MAGNALVCHPAAQIAFTGGRDGMLRVLDLLTRKTLRCESMSAGIECMAVSHTAQHVACALSDASGVVLQVQGLRVCSVWPQSGGSAPLETPRSPSPVLSFAKDNGSYSGREASRPLRGALSVMAFSPDDSLLIVGARDGSLALVRLSPTVVTRHASSPPPIHGSEGEVGEGGLGESSVGARIEGHASVVTGLDWSVCGRFVQSSGADLSLLFWEVTPTKISLLARSSLCRDVLWHTHTCLLGWGVQGVWEEGLSGATATCMSATHDDETLVVGDDSGHLSLFRFPACGPHSKRRRYGSHGSAGAGVAAARYIAKEPYVYCKRALSRCKRALCIYLC